MTEHKHRAMRSNEMASVRWEKLGHDIRQAAGPAPPKVMFAPQESMSVPVVEENTLGWN